MRTISLARGVPSPDLLPAGDIRDAAVRALEHDAAGALAHLDPQGYGPLREWIASRYGGSADRVLLTNGSLPGLALVAEHLFAGSGGRAVVEAPTYDRALLILKRFGATLESVALEPDGLDVGTLERACAAGRVPALVYVIPHFQNPGGVTLSREKRERLLALAAEYSFVIYEDDPYGELSFDAEPEASMLSLDREDRVLFSTSFTKTVAPGVRTGALIMPAALLPGVRTLAVDTYIGPNAFAEATIAEYCAAGRFEPGVAHMVAALRERRDALTRAIDEHLGDGVEYTNPGGGYFVWLRLPGVDADALADRANGAGVPVVKGSGCFVDGGGHDAIRLAFSACPAADMDEAISRLASLL